MSLRGNDVEHLVPPQAYVPILGPSWRSPVCSSMHEAHRLPQRHLDHRWSSCHNKFVASGPPATRRSPGHGSRTQCCAATWLKKCLEIVRRASGWGRFENRAFQWLKNGTGRGATTFRKHVRLSTKHVKMLNNKVSMLDSSAQGTLSRRHLATTQTGFSSTISGCASIASAG